MIKSIFSLFAINLFLFLSLNAQSNIKDFTFEVKGDSEKEIMVDHNGNKVSLLKVSKNTTIENHSFDGKYLIFCSTDCSEKLIKNRYGLYVYEYSLASDSWFHLNRVIHLLGKKEDKKILCDEVSFKISIADLSVDLIFNENQEVISKSKFDLANNQEIVYKNNKAETKEVDFNRSIELKKDYVKILITEASLKDFKFRSID